MKEHGCSKRYLQVNMTVIPRAFVEYSLSGNTVAIGAAPDGDIINCLDLGRWSKAGRQRHSLQSSTDLDCLGCFCPPQQETTYLGLERCSHAVLFLFKENTSPLCWLFLCQLGTSLSPFGRRNFSWENAPKCLAYGHEWCIFLSDNWCEMT